MEKSSKLIQNRSNIRVVRKSEPEIGPVYKPTAPLTHEQKRQVQFRPTCRTVGFIRVHASAFHLLSWLLSPSILEKLSFCTGVFLIFENKLSKFYFGEPQNSLFFNFYYRFFSNFFNHKLSPFWRWSMNVVNCLKIFCMHFCVFGRIKNYKYYFLDVWRNSNFLGQQHSLNFINKLLFYKFPVLNLYPKLLIFTLLQIFQFIQNWYFLGVLHIFSFLWLCSVDRWFSEPITVWEFQGIALNYCFDDC